MSYNNYYNNNYSSYSLYQGAQPIVYRTTRFKSKLEATWAIFFDQHNLEWQYESQLGEKYIVDFYLPDVFLEGHQTKGVFMETKSAGAWGDPRERNEIIRKAVSIIEKYGNHPFIIVLNQPGYHNDLTNPIYEISINEKGEPCVTKYEYFTLYKTGNIFKFTRLQHIPKQLANDARVNLEAKLNDFRTEYTQVKAASVRNAMKDAYEEEWTSKKLAKIERAKEIELHVEEYWEKNIKEFWTLEEFADAMSIKRWTPAYVKDGSYYSRNEMRDEYILWDGSIMVYNTELDTYEPSPRLKMVQKDLNKFIKLKSTLPRQTKIATPNNVQSLRRTNEAIEYEEYNLVFSIYYY